jgi:hypothetical protein
MVKLRKKSHAVCLSLDTQLLDEIDRRRQNFSRSSWIENVLYNAIRN